MEEITLLRRLRDDIVEPDAAALAETRARLMDGIRSTAAGAPAATPTTPWWRRRPVFAIAGVAAAAIAATAVFVGLPGLPGLPGPAGASAEAAELLHRAAASTTARADTQADSGAQGAGSVAIPAGSYLRVETHESALGYVPGAADGDPYLGAYVVPLVEVTYVPADTSAEWVRQHYSLPSTEIYGPQAVRDAADADYAVSAHEGDADGIERADAGVFGNGELGGGGDTPLTEQFAAMPRDAQQLLDHLIAAPGVDVSRQDKVVNAITSALRSGLVPADLQAAMYNALALLPGVTITADSADLDGRTGTAIGITSANGSETSEIIIDAQTGTYLGQRQVQNQAIGPVPAGTVMDSTSVRTEIVAGLPAALAG